MGQVSPARRLLFRLLAGLLGVALVAGVVALVASRGGSPQRVTVAGVAQDRPGTVLLVPGYGGSTSSLAVLADRLRQAGRTAVVVQLPGDGTGDLRKQADALDAAAQTALRAGAPSVDVVGYSAGGIVVRLWLKDEGGAASTRRVVTLGSPHHGTTLAAAGSTLSSTQCPQACRQLVPGSSLLADLNAGDETPAGPAYLSLWTTTDDTVTPPETARLDGATNVALQDLCPVARTSHSDLPRDPRVQAVVLAALAAGPVVVGPGCVSS
jgi:triacylglycerol lipase